MIRCLTEKCGLRIACFQIDPSTVSISHAQGLPRYFWFQDVRLRLTFTAADSWSHRCRPIMSLNCRRLLLCWRRAGVGGECMVGNSKRNRYACCGVYCKLTYSNASFVTESRTHTLVGPIVSEAHANISLRFLTRLSPLAFLAASPLFHPQPQIGYKKAPPSPSPGHNTSHTISLHIRLGFLGFSGR